jgi:hypothetical protein
MAAGATFEPIATYTVPSDTNSYTFSSISSAYTHLYITCNIKSVAPGYGLDYYMRLNGGTSGYYTTRAGATTASRSSTRADNQGSLQMFYVAAGVNANEWTAGEIWIPFYTNTTFKKNVQILGGSALSEVCKNGAYYDSTTAVSSVGFSSDGGFTGSAYIGAGSVFTIYGITKA